MGSATRSRWRSAPTGRASTSPRHSSDAVVRLNRNTTTGAITQPAGTAGCISETGAGPCADGHGLERPERGGGERRTGRASTSPRIASDAVARLNRNTTTGAITQPAGSAGCVSETGAGPCADGHGLDGPYGVAVSPDGKSVYVASCDSDAVARLNRNTTTGAITQPAGTAGCVSETGAGPCADGHGLDVPHSVAVSPDGKSVYVASPQQQRRGAPQPQHDHRGDHPARRDRRLHQRDGWRGRAPTAMGSAAPYVGGGEPGREERLRRLAANSDAVARLNRNTTTGAITQPAGTAGCVSETGAGPCADGHGLDGARRGGGEPGRKERLRRLVRTATPWRASTATRPPGRSPSPPGPPAASARRGRDRAPTAMGSYAPHGVAVSADGKSVYVASYRQRRRGALQPGA